jgi:hypothetical protein
MSAQKKLAVFLRLYIKARKKLDTQEIKNMTLDQLLLQIGLDKTFIENAEDSDIDKVVHQLDTLYKEQMEVDLLIKQVRYLSTSDLKSTKLIKLQSKLAVKTSVIDTSLIKFNADNLEIKARIAKKMGDEKTADELHSAAEAIANDAAVALENLKIVQDEQKALNDELRQSNQPKKPDKNKERGSQATIEKNTEASSRTRNTSVSTRASNESRAKISNESGSHSQARGSSIAVNNGSISNMSRAKISNESAAASRSGTKRTEISQSKEPKRSKPTVPKLAENGAVKELNDKKKVAQEAAAKKIAQDAAKIAQEAAAKKIAQDAAKIAQEAAKKIAQEAAAKKIAQEAAKIAASAGSGGSTKAANLVAAADELMELECQPYKLVLKPVLGQKSTKVRDVLKKCNGPLTKVPGVYDGCGFTAPWQGQHTYDVWGNDVIIGPGIDHFWECTSYKSQIYWGQHHICAACFYEMCRLKANGDLDDNTMDMMIN